MNQQLRDELLSMQEEDREVLQSLIDSGELGTTKYHPRMKQIHEKNIRIQFNTFIIKFMVCSFIPTLKFITVLLMMNCPGQKIK